MFTVIVTEKGGEQRRMDFDKPEVTIGRVQGNDIILPKGNVSKRHSRIVLKDGKFIIVDLKSTNGTYVNGRKITSPLVIKEADKVYIGDFIITIEEPGAEKLADKALATPIPPPAVPSGIYEASLGPPGAGAPSLIANPPPAPKRPAGAVPPPVPGAAVAAARRPEMEAEEIDLEDSRPAPMPTGPAREPRESQPVARAAAPPRPTAEPAAARPAAAGALGRTTAREEAAAAAPAMAPPPGPRTSPPAPSVPVAARAAAPPAERARPTVKSFDAVQPPVSEAPIAAPSARAPELLRELHDRVAAQLDLSRLPIERFSDETLWQRAQGALVDLVEQLEADGALPSGIDPEAVVKEALAELLGLGPLDELLGDDDVGDVLVNRPDRILVERSGRIAPSPRIFSSETALRQVVDRLLAPTGHRLDEGAPLIDVRLPGGARVTAALPPLAVRGLALTVRKPRRTAASLDELVKFGALSQQMASFLATCITARRNLLVCGGAAAGKSAFLGALAGLVPGNERIVSVEEVAELSLPHEQWIALESQAAGAALADVVRAALRMRPDRLVIGDIRGAEALEVLSAFAAGEGGLASVTGDGAAAALARLESLARLAAPEASPRGLRELTAHAAQVVVHVARYSDGVRRVAAITEVTGVQGDGYGLRELFTFQMQGHGPDGVRGRFAGAGIVPRFYSELEARGEKADPAVFR